MVVRASLITRMCTNNQPADGTQILPERIRSASLPAAIEDASNSGDPMRRARLLELQATDKKRYDFESNINALNFVPETFGSWLMARWCQYESHAASLLPYQ
jgi:hypothetical protein